MTPAPQGVRAHTPGPVPPIPSERFSGAATLDAELLAAHASGDRAALVGLYAQAAEAAAPAERAFFLTQAYVFALETGDSRAATLKAALVRLGADTA